MRSPRSRFAPFVGLVAFLSASGCEPPARLQVSDGASDVVATGFLMGGVAITKSTQRSMTVRNVSDAMLTLQSIAVSGTAAFSLVGDGCRAGQLLAVDATCTVAVLFAPTEPGEVHARVTLLAIQGDDPAAATVVDVYGTGILDCSVATDLTASRGKGVGEAETENQRQIARGEADGRALTYDDGYKATYDASYDAGYRSGYDDPSYGYSAGYAAGYAIGQQAGLADTATCSRGGNDGAAGGYHDGEAGGYSAGNTAGFAAGYGDGKSYYFSYGCPTSLVRPMRDGNNAPQKIEGPSPPNLVQACYAQGYAATLRTNAYAQALEQAKLANQVFQNGRKSGDAKGYADGVPAGRAKGNADGQVAGHAAGFTDGITQRYDQCYQSGYAQTYGGAYQDGYAQGHAAGYDAGYYAGYEDVCGP